MSAVPAVPAVSVVFRDVPEDPLAFFNVPGAREGIFQFMPLHAATLCRDVRRAPRGTFLSALLFVSLTLCAALAQAHGALSVRAGGGWTSPRADSAAYIRNGLTGEAALELELGPNLGIALGGGYTAFALKASRLKADLGLPPEDPLQGDTKILDLTLAPRLYLLNHDIAAFVTLGGGPRWVNRHTVAAGTGATADAREFAWGAVVGFGVDMGFSEGFRVGFAPTYHRVNTDRRPLQYAAFTFYLKL